MRLWNLLNSNFGLWILTTVFVGTGVWVFEALLNQRNETRTLEERQSRLELEIEGRLYQYNRWFEGLYTSVHREQVIKSRTARKVVNDNESGREFSLNRTGDAKSNAFDNVFHKCVDTALLNASITSLAGGPGKYQFIEHGISDDRTSLCAEPLIIHPIFAEFKDQALIGTFMELGRVIDQLHPPVWVPDPDLVGQNEIDWLTLKILYPIGSYTGLHLTERSEQIAENYPRSDSRHEASLRSSINVAIAALLDPSNVTGFSSDEKTILLFDDFQDSFNNQIWLARQLDIGVEGLAY